MHDLSEDRSTVGHILLDIAGLIPGVGEVADATNAWWYAKEGDFLMAALSLVSVIPEIGDLIGKGSKLAVALDRTGRSIRRVQLLIRSNRSIIDGVLAAAGRDERLAQYVPRMRDALDAFVGHRRASEAIARLRALIREVLIAQLPPVAR